jgi:hypothetical protein
MVYLYSNLLLSAFIRDFDCKYRYSVGTESSTEGHVARTFTGTVPGLCKSKTRTLSTETYHMIFTYYKHVVSCRKENGGTRRLYSEFSTLLSASQIF